MNESKITLSPRLQIVASSIIGGVVADIGTDHAYLPIAIIQQDICAKVIACDLNLGPLSIAKKNIEAVGLTNKIEIRHGDGLSPLRPGEADCIVITGMGGMLIWKIISNGMAQAKQSRLIMQPQHDIPLLRQKLHSAGFCILDEDLVQEKDHFYVSIVAVHSGDNICWSEREYFLGKKLIEKGGKDFLSYIMTKRKKIKSYILQIRDEESLIAAKKQLEWLD